jgi:putative transposase
VGIDRGVSVFAALSTGELIAPASVGKKALRALAHAQRNAARKVKGSNNRRRAQLRVARLHMRVANARKDYLHKLSTTIAQNHGLVVIEKLNVGAMTRSAKGTIDAPGRNVRAKAGLNRAILDQGWGAFREMLAYKLPEYGGRLIEVPAAYTSQTCSACGVIDADSRQDQRFECRACGHSAHADHNASLNILRRGTASMPVEGRFLEPLDEAGTCAQSANADEAGCRPVMLACSTPTKGPDHD